MAIKKKKIITKSIITTIMMRMIISNDSNNNGVTEYAIYEDLTSYYVQDNFSLNKI